MTQTTITESNSVGIVTPKTMDINTPLELLCGETLQSHSLVYETYGELNRDKSNAILICHALSGNHHAAGFYTDPNSNCPNNIDTKTAGSVSYTHLTLPTTPYV